MLPALILALAALGIALLRLWSYRAQLLDMARMLEETPAESNLRLTVRMSGAAPRRLCRAINARLEEGRRLRLEARQQEQELKYTMACISHDIRTPLAGAVGYLELLEGEPDRQEEYLDIVRNCSSIPGYRAVLCRWSAGKRRFCRPCGRSWRSSTPNWRRRGWNRRCALTGRI